jgi:hypothetical protein
MIQLLCIELFITDLSQPDVDRDFGSCRLLEEIDQKATKENFTIDTSDLRQLRFDASE